MTASISADDLQLHVLVVEPADLKKLPFFDLTVAPRIAPDDALTRAILTAEIKIRYDGGVLWVNFGPRCLLRICGLKRDQVVIEDDRKQA